MSRISASNNKALISLWLICGMLCGCATPGSTSKAGTNETTLTRGTATAVGLPSFSDWRVAYLDQSGKFEIVSLKDQSTIAGKSADVYGLAGLHLGSAGVSANGHLFATTSNYAAVIVTSIASASSTNDSFFQIKNSAAQTVSWSQDSQSLAISDNEGGIWIARLANGQMQQVPHTTTRMTSMLIGWIDSAHIAVGGFTDPQHFVLSTLDITTGSLNTLKTISSSGLGNMSCWISPDGKHVILGNRSFRDNLYIPELDVIDTATGATTSLAAIAKAMGGNFSMVAWRPGTQQFAVTAGFIANGKVTTDLIDLANNLTRQLTDSFYPAAWTPDGSTIILSTGLDSNNAIDFGPYTIASLPVQADGTPGTLVTLTTKAYFYNIVGLVQNPA